MKISNIMTFRHWAGLFRPCLCLAATAAMTIACDTESLDFGSIDYVENVVQDGDQIVTGTAQLLASTTSGRLSAVRANSRTCYFGRVSDPATGICVKADYACQVHCFEGVNFPPLDSMVYVTAAGDTARCENPAQVVCDSVELIMYYGSWQGDKNAPLKVSVLPLLSDEQHIMEADSIFFTDVNLLNYVDGANVLATKAITAWDNTLSLSELTDPTHTHCARITMPASLGDEIMRHYYTTPADFKDSYTFTRKVCPGYYVRFDGGDNAMLNVTSTSLNIYYKYEAADSIYKAYTNFVGTAEVVQATHFEAEGLDGLLQESDCSYVSSPAGIYTEVELPLDEIFQGHEADSLARVQLTLARYNSNGDGTLDTDAVFAPPSTLGMIMKSELTAFFERGYELQSRKFATTTLTESLNVYDFSNIARLVTYMYERRDEGDPDWNKVALVPVKVNTNATAGTVIGVQHDMSVTAARLVGGAGKVKVNVTYSRYK